MINEAVAGKTINNSKELYNIIKPFLAGEDQNREHFVCIFLDSKNCCIAIETVISGTINSSAVYPREIIRRGFDLGAAALIVGHNHPSGDVTPSPQDLQLTWQLFAATSVCGITLHEHIIIGKNGKYSSLADNGQIEEMRRRLNSYDFYIN
jgi:DNA repair protein RadC